MPIYKVSQSTSGSADLQWSAADGGIDSYADPPAINVGKLPQQAYQAYLTNGDYDEPEVGQRNGKTESVIEREIREQRERERELAAMRKLYQQQQEAAAAAAAESFQTQPTTSADDIIDQHHVIKTDRTDGSIEDYVIHRSPEPVSVAWGAPAVDEQPEVIPKVPNPEENLILREMIEQQRREEELRQHWKEMGFELYEGHVDEDDDDEGEVFGRGGNASTGNSIQLELEAVRTQRRATLGDGSTLSASTPSEYRQQYENDYTSQQKTTTSVTWSDTRVVETSDQPFPETPKTSTTRRPLVLPISDDDGLVNDVPETVHRQLFEPHNESVIEREIRLAREREEALRQLRGLPPRPEDLEERRSRLVEVAVQLRDELNNRPVRRSKSEVVETGRVSVKTDFVDATNDEVFAKRFAESRLKAELQQERQRELDLRRKGLIHTISEERAGDPIRYVDMLDSGTPAAAVPSPASTKRLSGSRQYASKTTPEPVVTAPAAAAAATEAVATVSHASETRKFDEPVEVTAKTEVILAKPEVKIEKQEETVREQISKQEKKEQKVKPVQNSTVPETRRELPAVLRTYSYPYADQQLVTSATDDTKLTPEERIEEEVAEFKRREAELRALRETLRLLPPPLVRDQPSVEGREIVRERPREATAFDEDEYLLEVRSRQQQDANSEKRRLALIEQWEKKSLESAAAAAATSTAASAAMPTV